MIFNPHPKPTRWHSIKYENWVRSTGCIICGQPGQVHHAKGVGHLSGTALKAPSWATMCLCECHHGLMQEYLLKKEVQWELIGKTLGRAIDEGVFKLAK